MENIPLNYNLKLSFEKLPHTIRLIVSKDSQELVCRKEKLNKLLSFSSAVEEHLFKGRLQLSKSGNKINIQVKHQHIDSISNESFRKALDKLK